MQPSTYFGSVVMPSQEDKEGLLSLCGLVVQLALCTMAHQIENDEALRRGRALVVWDFDWSLINENSDYYVVKKLGDVSEFRAKQKEPQFAVFTDLMHESMRSLHARGHRKADIDACLSKIPVFPEMIEAVKLITERGHDQIIVSDANSVFIDTILNAIGLSDIFPPEKVFTNPARWDADEQLHVTWAHPKEGAPHGCVHCQKNICKGNILKDWLRSRDADSTPSKILYVGDGGGDLCPCLTLGPSDAVLARKDYTLHKRLSSDPSSKDLQASLHPWTEGKDALQVFKDALHDTKSSL